MPKFTLSRAVFFRRAIWPACCGFIGILSLGLTTVLIWDRGALTDRAVTSVEHAAKLASIVIDQMLNDIGGVVASVQSSLSTSSESFEVAVRSRQAELGDQLGRRPQVRAFTILNRDGVVTASNMPSLVGRNSSDLDYFRAHLVERHRSPYVSDPFIAPRSGYRLFLASWPLLDDDGSLLGVIAVSFDTVEIEFEIGGFDRPESDVAVLLKGNGLILAARGVGGTQGLEPSAIDADLSAFAADPALAGSGLARIEPAVIAGHQAEWAVAVQPLSTFDGAVVIAADMGRVLLPWRWRLWAVIAGAAILISSVVVSAFALVKLLHQQSQALVSASTAALTDPLTGLHNRRMFDQRAEIEWRRASHDGRDMCLLALDLDHFKRINDRYGHAFGDRLLVRVADAMREVFRQDDLVARMGGEEFIVLLPRTTLARAKDVAERLRTFIMRLRVSLGEQKVGVTVSIGVAPVCPGADPIATAYAAADEALYRAKAEGRNRVVVASSAIGLSPSFPDADRSSTPVARSTPENQAPVVVRKPD